MRKFSRNHLYSQDHAKAMRSFFPRPAHKSKQSTNFLDVTLAVANKCWRFDRWQGNTILFVHSTATIWLPDSSVSFALRNARYLAFVTLSKPMNAGQVFWLWRKTARVIQRDALYALPDSLNWQRNAIGHVRRGERISPKRVSHDSDLEQGIQVN